MLFVAPEVSSSKYLGSKIIWDEIYSNYVPSRDEDEQGFYLKVLHMENAGRKHSEDIRVYVRGEIDFLEVEPDVLVTQHLSEQNPYFEIKKLASGEKVEVLLMGSYGPKVKRVTEGGKAISSAWLEPQVYRFGYVEIHSVLLIILMPLCVAGFVLILKGFLAIGGEKRLENE